MKFYMLKKSAPEYVYYHQGVVYREDDVPLGGLTLKRCVETWPKDWRQVKKFRFGRKYRHNV